MTVITTRASVCADTCCSIASMASMRVTVCCSFQQTRVDPNTPSEEFTTAAIVVDSWLRVRGLGFRVNAAYRHILWQPSSLVMVGESAGLMQRAAPALHRHVFVGELALNSKRVNVAQVDPAKSKAFVLTVLEKLQKMAAVKHREWNNDKINQNIFRLYLSRILIQRSSMQVPSLCSVMHLVVMIVSGRRL